MANDFSSESRCKALWRFENGALTTDSKGTNTLTASASSPTSDTTNYREGSGSAYFTRASAQYFSIPDASLDAGFPFKGASPVQTATIMMWVKFAQTNYDRGDLFMKWGNTAGIALQIKSNYLRGQWGGTGGQVYNDFSPAMSTGRWYFIAAKLDGPNKVFNLRIYDATAGTVANYSWTPAYAYSPPSVPSEWKIGSNAVTEHFDGNIDGFVVFDSVLTDTEIDKIRNDAYFPSIQVEQSSVQVAWAESPKIKVEQAATQIGWQSTPRAVVPSIIEQVEFGLEPELRVTQLFAQVEVIREVVSAYVSEVMLQVEYGLQTNVEVELDTIPIEITQMAPTIQLVVAQDTVNILIEALTMFPPGYGVSVSTENILITPKNISISFGVNVSTISIDILLLVATVELIAKRKFPLPPDNRQLQSQLYRRKFPLGH